MDNNWLAAQTELTALDLRGAMGNTDNDEVLRLTGLEPVLLGIAYKAVIGIVSGFVGRLIYDKWKSARSRKQLDEIVAGLSRKVIGAVHSAAVDENVIKADVIDTLTLEGLTLEQARTVCDKTFARVWDHLHGM